MSMRGAVAALAAVLLPVTALAQLTVRPDTIRRATYSNVQVHGLRVRAANVYASPLSEVRVSFPAGVKWSGATVECGRSAECGIETEPTAVTGLPRPAIQRGDTLTMEFGVAFADGFRSRSIAFPIRMRLSDSSIVEDTLRVWITRSVSVKRYWLFGGVTLAILLLAAAVRVRSRR
jgi:hypothetical protein